MNALATAGDQKRPGTANPWLHDMPAGSAALSGRCDDCAIRGTCTLNRLCSEERSLAGRQIRERIFHRGDVLQEEDELARFVRFVKLGTVFGYRRGLDGRSRPIGAVTRGNALGLFSVFEMPSQVTCVALTTVRVCEVPVADLRELSQCGSKLLVQISRSVSEIFGAVITWSEAMRLPGVANQLAYVLVLLSDAAQAPVIQLPGHEALAELLGTRRESIARALRSLEGEGGIRRREGKRCEVHRDKLLSGLAHGD